jgi:hypothetical protein
MFGLPPSGSTIGKHAALGGQSEVVWQATPHIEFPDAGLSTQ